VELANYIVLKGFLDALVQPDSLLALHQQQAHTIWKLISNKVFASLESKKRVS
jgi:hypothetical protein